MGDIIFEQTLCMGFALFMRDTEWAGYDEGKSFAAWLSSSKYRREWRMQAYRNWEADNGDV